MKNSNYNTRQHFETLVEQERERKAPSVNVRAAVRQSLAEGSSVMESEDVLDVLLDWFSGVRGKVVTGVAVLSVLALAAVVYTQIDGLSEQMGNQENDELTAFIDDGDWSALL